MRARPDGSALRILPDEVGGRREMLEVFSSERCVVIRPTQMRVRIRPVAPRVSSAPTGESVSSAHSSAVASNLHLSNQALRHPAGQLRCLPNPPRHEHLVELVVLVNIEVAHFLVLGLAWRERTQ